MSPRRKLTLAVYVLTRDVKNPKADRREKYDPTKLAIWRKGSQIVVRLADIDCSGDIGWRSWPVLEFVGAKGHGQIPQTDARFALIVEACEPVPETLATLLHRLQFTSHKTLLEELLADGKISLLDVEAAYERWLDRNSE